MAYLNMVARDKKKTHWLSCVNTVAELVQNIIHTKDSVILGHVAT